MWLTEDITGPSSGIPFGKKGLEVSVLEVRAEMSRVQDNDGNMFWMRSEFLSEEKPEGIPEPEIIAEPVKQSKGKKRGMAKQNKLF